MPFPFFLALYKVAGTQADSYIVNTETHQTLTHTHKNIHIAAFAVTEKWLEWAAVAAVAGVTESETGVKEKRRRRRRVGAEKYKQLRRRMVVVHV